MKVVGISGSPRRGGNIEKLLDSALKGAKSRGASVSKIILNELKFKPCQECEGCKEEGVCTVEDDMQAVYERMQNAEAVIIASPIFFGSLSAQVKMMIDRFQCLWVLKYVLKNAVSSENRRKGIFLCISGTKRKEFFENAKSIIKIFFATLDIDYIGDLYYGGLDTTKNKEKRREALKKAFDLGRSLVRGRNAFSAT